MIFIKCFILDFHDLMYIFYHHARVLYIVTSSCFHHSRSLCFSLNSFSSHINPILLVPFNFINFYLSIKFWCSIFTMWLVLIKLVLCYSFNHQLLCLVSTMSRRWYCKGEEVLVDEYIYSIIVWIFFVVFIKITALLILLVMIWCGQANFI